MGNVFHGWRRKTGCLVLFVAVTICCGWVRSLQTTDQFCRVRQRSYTELLSIDGRLAWGECVCHGDQPFRHPSAGLSHCETPKLDVFPYNPERGQWTKRSYFEFAGFIYSSVIKSQDRSEMVTWIIPYWSVVLPLTLLSAYLILWTPRKKIAARQCLELLKRVPD